jgi:hypothetical protein
MSKNLIQDVVKIKKSAIEKKPEGTQTDIDAKFDSLYSHKKTNNTATSKNSSNFNDGIVHRVKSVGREMNSGRIRNTERDEYDFDNSEFYNNSNSGSKKIGYGLWFIALIALVFLFFAVSYLFSGAKISINPKTVDLSLDENFVASKNSNSGILPFDLVMISDEAVKEVQGGEEVDVKQSATGTVVIYNNFSTAAQKLDINTRLEGSNGKIYKTKNAVVVPGMSSNNTPGSVEVDIYASEAGEAYNSGPIDFNIFGFKGTPKYTKFYARSKGEISGGLVGKARQVSEIEKTSAINELKDSLRDKLLQKATNQTPSGYLLYDDAIFIQFDNGTVGDALENGMVPVKVKGTFYGFLFDEKKLTKRIVQNNLEKYANEDVFIPNIRSFKFTLNNKENINFAEVKDINFDLVGNSKIVWRIDTESLLNEVLGRDKKDFNQILTQYANIDSAELVIKPVWRKTFPDKLKDIKILVNYP